nr:NADH dehydrogenase subunit 3 [Mileewa rufivena]
MNLVILFFITVMLMSMAILLLIMTISKKSIIDTQKSTPFECGFNPTSYKRLPFSIHFFLIAVIFLIFDIEIIIIIPMILTMKTTMSWYWMNTIISLIIVLIMGLYHEWNNGMLLWTK